MVKHSYLTIGRTAVLALTLATMSSSAVAQPRPPETKPKPDAKAKPDPKAKPEAPPGTMNTLPAISMVFSV